MCAGTGVVERSNSETDSLLSDGETSQTFMCWQEDLAGDTSLCSPVVDELILANVCDLGWDKEKYLSELSIADSEKYERKMCESYRKVFAQARFPLPCAPLHGVGDVCLVHCEHGYRFCHEFSLIRRWACGRADDYVTPHADLEMRDLLKTAASQSTPSATKPLRVRNDFEDFCYTERSQLVCSAEIAPPILTS